MTPRLWLSSLTYLKQHPIQVFLSILGISLGVAVIISIDLSNQSAKRAFSLSTNAITDQTTHFIMAGPNGLPQEILRQVTTDLSIQNASPIIESNGIAFIQESLEKQNPIPIVILGIDPFSEIAFRPHWSQSSRADISGLISSPNTIFTTQSSADRLNLSIGDVADIEINGMKHSLTLIGILDTTNTVTDKALSTVIFTDISTAQEITNRSNTISRIDLIISDSEATNIQELLPDGIYITSSESRNLSATQITRAFDVNLSALGLLALVVGAFIIYNTITFSVVRRRKLIGMMRAIGVSRAQIFALIIIEGILTGIAGAITGIFLGILLGKLILNIVVQTINDLYFSVTVNELSVDPATILQATVLGILVATVSAAIPAIEATRVPPGVTITRSSLEMTTSKYIPYASATGILALLASTIILITPSTSLILGFTGLFLLVLGGALLIPIMTVIALTIIASPLRYSFGIIGSIATRSILNSLSRTSIAIATLTIAISLTVGIGLMIQSFRSTVDVWLDTALGNGIYISSPSVSLDLEQSAIEEQILTALQSMPEIASIDTFRRTKVNSPTGSVNVVAIHTAYETFNRPERFKYGDPATVWDMFQKGSTILISEPFAYRNNLNVGSRLVLNTDGGPKSFSVGAIYYDYSSSDGIVMISSNIYQDLWNDKKTSSARIHLTEGHDIDDVIFKISTITESIQTLEIRSDDELKQAALEVFDRSFKITSVMRIIAIIIAFVGILGALLALQTESRKEMSILKTIGLVPSQISRLLATQSLLIGLLAGIFAIPVGISMAAGLIYVVNSRSFGWSMEIHIYPYILFEAILIAIVASLSACAYPAIRTLTTPSFVDLRDE